MITNKIRYLFIPAFLAIILIFPFTSCSNSTIFLSDRHVYSYDKILNYAEKNGPVTLVLIDYHNDINQSSDDVLTSYNWIGKLIQKGHIKELIWVSGHTMLLPNKNARLAWLNRNLSSFLPEEKEKILNLTRICDWTDLKKLKLTNKDVITLDFDFFAKDGGNPPEAFVKELTCWINKLKPQLLTVSLSASYQKNPYDMWNRFYIFLKEINLKALWYADFENFGTLPESLDDKKSWNNWNTNFNKFRAEKYCFCKGAYLWLSMPQEIKQNLLKKNIIPMSQETEKVLSVLNQENKIEDLYTPLKNQLTTIAFNALEKSFNDINPYQPVEQNAADPNTIGIAVRFKNAGTDRGCLSLYRGVSHEMIFDAVRYCAAMAGRDPRYPFITQEEFNDLTVNICIFDNWEQMTDSLDFIPGFHSLLLKDEKGEITLLQSSIAWERDYTRKQFLSRLSNKAGLGFNGWKESGLTFYKSATLSFYGSNIHLENFVTKNTN